MSHPGADRVAARLATLSVPGDVPPPGELSPSEREQLLARAAREGVFVEVADRLVAGGDRDPVLARALRTAAVRAEAQHVLLAGLAERLAAAGIPFVVLKGQPLDRRCGLSSHRWHRDVDLLVPEESVAQAATILRGMGFHPPPGPPSPRAFHRPFASRARELLGTVELHWNVTPPGHPVRFDVAAWLARPAETTLPWGRVPVPPPEDEPGYLAWHAFSRGLPPLRDLLPLAEAWSRLEPAGRERALARARRAGAAGFLAAGLLLSAAAWPDRLPPGARALATILPGGVRGRCLASCLHVEKILGPIPATWQEHLLVHWALLPAGNPGLGTLLVRTLADEGGAEETGEPVSLPRLLRATASLLLRLAAALPGRQTTPALVPRPAAGQDERRRGGR